MRFRLSVNLTPSLLSATLLSNQYILASLSRISEPNPLSGSELFSKPLDVYSLLFRRIRHRSFTI